METSVDAVGCYGFRSVKIPDHTTYLFWGLVHIENWWVGIKAHSMQLVRLFDRESGEILKIFLNQRLLQLAYVLARKAILKSEI